MKRIGKNILRRRSAPPECFSSNTTPKMASSTKHLVVDLARPDALPALHVLRQTPALQRGTENATINLGSYSFAGLDGSHKMNQDALEEAFATLADLPCLQQVSIDFAELELPVYALVILLRRSRSLREILLTNLTLAGTAEHIELLNAALASKRQLIRVRCHNCRGVALQSFMTHLPRIRKLELRKCNIRHSAVTAQNAREKNPFSTLGQSPTLSCLTLQDVADLQNDDILALTHALSEPGSVSSLQELHLTSCGRNSAATTSQLDGNICGAAVAELFAAYNPHFCRIRTLTLKFGSTWTTAGSTMAGILQNQLRPLSSPLSLSKPHHQSNDGNSSLNSLCVELAGKTAVSQGQEILTALRTNHTLKRLKICFNWDLSLGGPLEASFQRSLGALLQDNHKLQSVILLDENRDCFALSEECLYKLELNASVLPLLLHTNTGVTGATSQQQRQQQEDYLNAMIDAKDSLNAVYYALSKNPSLLLQAMSLDLPVADSSVFAGMEHEGGDDEALSKGRRRSARLSGIFSFSK